MWTEVELLSLSPFLTPLPSRLPLLVPSALGIGFLAWECFIGSRWSWYWVAVVFLAFNPPFRRPSQPFLQGQLGYQRWTRARLERAVKMQFACVFSIAPDGCSLGQHVGDDSVRTQKGNVRFADVTGCITPLVPKCQYSTITSDVNRRTGRALCFYGRSSAEINHKCSLWGQRSCMLSRFLEEAESVAGCSHKMAWRDAWEGRMKVIGRVNKSMRAKNCLFVVFYV